MTKRFWVVGGDYTDTGFHTLADETRKVFGPFNSYEAARMKWREEAMATKSSAYSRFTIAQEA